MNRKELKKELEYGELTHTDIKALLIYSEITIDDLISVVTTYAQTINNIKLIL